MSTTLCGSLESTYVPISLPGFQRELLVSVDDLGGYDIVISEIPSQVDGVLG